MFLPRFICTLMTRSRQPQIVLKGVLVLENIILVQKVYFRTVYNHDLVFTNK